MIKMKILISIIIFSSFLIGTSFIKNQTRELEKKIYSINKEITLREIDLNESQLDFSYLTSPDIIERKVELLDQIKYVHMEYSKIFLSLSNFLDLENKLVTHGNENGKKIQKK